MNQGPSTGIEVAYHMYWPSSADPFYVLNPTQNTARKTYYGVNATPTLKVDGVLDIWPISIASVTNAIDQRRAIPSHLWLDASITVNGTTVNATAKAVADVNITGNKVIQMILVNRYSYIPNPPNGNPNFYAAMRLMSPSANGQPFTATAGDTVTYSCVFHLNPTWDVTNQDLVCFVQDNDLREVMQSHMEPITPQPAQDVDVVLSPVNPPIQIPAQGGSFSFNINLINHLDSTAHFHTWIMQQNPAGLWEGPQLGPIWLAFPASLSITRMRSQNVPGSAAPGIYTYWGYVGMYNEDAHWDSSSFTYTKLTTGNGPLVTDWENYGESFDQVEKTGLTEAIPSEYVTIAANPNPFNPTTAISYKLQAASYVSLKVYDTAGRLVATLSDGWRDAGSHEVTFDGSNLASGMYLYTVSAGQHTVSGKMLLLK